MYVVEWFIEVLGKWNPKEAQGSEVRRCEHFVEVRKWGLYQTYTNIYSRSWNVRCGQVRKWVKIEVRKWASGAQVRWKVRKWARCKWESSGCASEAFALAVPSWKLLAAWYKLELIKTQRWKMLLRLCWRLLGMLIWPAMTLLMMHNNIFSVFSVFWWKQVWTSIVPTMTALHH